MVRQAIAEQSPRVLESVRGSKRGRVPFGKVLILSFDPERLFLGQLTITFTTARYSSIIVTSIGAVTIVLSCLPETIPKKRINTPIIAKYITGKG